jgi:hypothetical protein
MKDFKDYLDAAEPEVDESVLSDAMWGFISSLDEQSIEDLDEYQLAEYIEIVEAVAGAEEDELEESDKDILTKNQHKDAFTLSDDEAAPLLKKKLIAVNKSTRNVSGKGKSYSITDKGKDFVESVEGDLAEAMPAKRVRRDVIQKRKASREHRKVKAKKKIEGRRKRKTASFKRFKKKAKRLGKRGLTSTGKRKRTFINKG